MSRFLTDANGRRIWIDNPPAPAPEPEPEPSRGPPMAPRDNWVDGFLNGPVERLPVNLSTRTNRPARRKFRRRF